MKILKINLLICLGLIISNSLFCQFTGVSGGLSFSSGIDFNTGTTGNPGIYGRAYYKMNKRLYLTSSLSVFNRYKRGTFSETLKTYMFQGDLDGTFSLYKDKSLRFVGIGGINATAITSKWDIIEETPNSKNLINKSEIKPGLNLGGAFQLYVNDDIDAYISAKYIVSSFDQLVINVGAIYYIGGQRRRGAW